jgi:hypothetical protein
VKAHEVGEPCGQTNLVALQQFSVEYSVCNHYTHIHVYFYIDKTAESIYLARQN